MAIGFNNSKPTVVQINSSSQSAEAKAYASKQKMGILAPEFKVYIEGVQVPFESLHVSEVYGQIPTASITMPYLPFLQEIARNYPAKIHIFFKDMISERYFFEKNDGNKADTMKYEFRLLFSGVIKGATYQKNKNPYGASTTISFQCQHKNYVAAEILTSFSRFNTNDASVEKYGSVAGTVAGVAAFNPAMVAQQAMQGVDTSGAKVFNPLAISDLAKSESKPSESPEGYDTSGIPKALIAYTDQFNGVPGVVLRLWNIMCLDGYKFRHQQDFMSRIYIPLMANIKYFEGMVGHPLVENYLEKNRVMDDTPQPEAGVTANMAKLNPLGATTTMYGEVNALGAAATQATEMAVIQGLQSADGDVSFDQFYGSIIKNMLYDTLTLTSPGMRVSSTEETEAEGDLSFVTSSATVAPVETIVRAVMPIYFSPKCNVVYPRMYSSVQINDLYDDSPTRVMSLTPEVTQSSSLPVAFRYRSPINVREATYDRIKGLVGDAKEAAVTKYNEDSLKEGFIGTVAMFHETPASHEMGRGVKARVESMPQWLMYMVQGMEVDSSPSSQGVKDKNRRDFRKLLMDYTDYLFSVANTGHRSGSVSCCFNPYIIPGYPMDVVDPSQDRPSHHGFCTSKTHMITSSECRTEISFSNAMTYEEIYAYETPTALPWLERLLNIKKLDLDNNQYYTSIANADDETKAAANKYYSEVLGVGAAFVDDLSEYKYKETSSIVDGKETLRETRAFIDSLEDSLAACRRSVQTMASVEDLFGMKFIDTAGLPAAMSSGKVLRNYPFKPPTTKGNSGKFILAATRPGHNLFLNYDQFVTDPARASTVNPGSTIILGGRTVVTVGDVNSDTDVPVLPTYLQHIAGWQARDPAAANTAIRLDNALFATYGSNPFPANYKKGLFLAVLWKESSFTWQVASDNKNPLKWAYGYGQILPKWHNGKKNGKKVPDLTPAENVELAQEILLGEFKSFKNWNDAVVAYNQGGGTVSSQIEGGRVYYSRCTLDFGGAEYFKGVFQV